MTRLASAGISIEGFNTPVIDIMRFTIGLFALALPLSAFSAEAQQARVEIDHATGAKRLIVQQGTREDTTALDEPVVRLSRSIPVDIRVVSTNTALYRFSRTSEAVALPEAESIQGFAGRLTPYVPELRAALNRYRGTRGAEDGAPTAETIAAARTKLALALGGAERSLLAIDEAVYGEGGLQPTLTTTLLALEQMRLGMRAEEAAEPLRRSLNLTRSCGDQDPVRLQTAQQLLTSLSALSVATDQLRDQTYGISLPDSAWRALRDSAQVLEERAQNALSDFEPLVANAYRVERLVGIVANACSQWSTGPVTGTRTKGRSVTVRVDPRTEPELSRVADRGPAEFTVVVAPQPFIRPAVAVGGVAAPGARFPTYATREVPGGLEIYESGRKDRRFGLAGTLGFTWPGLDGRNRSGVAVWVPEIIVAAGDLTGAGVGGAVSVGFVKIGAGALWMRHERLEGARAGDVVPDESGMRVVDGYGKPELYISLSVFDWAPFANRIPED